MSQIMLRAAADYIAFPEFVSSGPNHGHVPFAIRLLSLAGYYYHGTTTDGAVSPTARCNVFGQDSSLGELLLNHEQSGIVVFDPDDPLNAEVPKVTEANIDDAGRLFTTVTGDVNPAVGTDFVRLALEYEALNPEDFGKEIHGIGSTSLCASWSDGAYAPLWFPSNHVLWPLGGVLEYFITPYETSNTIAADGWETSSGPRGAMRVGFGDSFPIAGCPMPVDGQFSDFMCVIRTGGGADAPYVFNFRKNGNTVASITCDASGARVFATGSTVDVRAGDKVNWQVETHGGGGIAAELLWAFRPFLESGTGRPFGDEFGGVF